MSPHNRIWTVDDLNEGGGPGLASDKGGSGGGGGGGGGAPVHLSSCHHIPTLPLADQAQLLLRRVVREFEPIARDRGYNILSVSEMCCCGDGLDHLPGARRKRSKQPNSVWGYNQWTSSGGGGGGRKTHTIHLRLRHPADHSKFLMYEDVAGTMAHELAHCEHGPHNDKFYKLMDEILEQHAVLMASGLSRDGGYTMPAFAGSGQALGSASGGARGAFGGGRMPAAAVGRRPTPQQVRDARLRNLQGKGGGARGGYKLGGDGLFTQWMTPAEAAVVAAEARRRMQQLRLRGDRCCRVIEINDDHDGDGDDILDGSAADISNESGRAVNGQGGERLDRKNRVGEHDMDVNSVGRGRSPVDEADRKPAAARAAANRSLIGNAGNSQSQPRDNRPIPSKRQRGVPPPPPMGYPDAENRKLPPPSSVTASAKAAPKAMSDVIDLTGDEHDVASTSSASGGGRAARPPSGPSVASRASGHAPWACSRCTFLNEASSTDACAVCEAPRFSNNLTVNQCSRAEDETTTLSVRLRVFK